MAPASRYETEISLFSPLVAAATPANGGEGDNSCATDASWDRILNELHRLWNLPDDWDGQGAQALDPGNVAAVERWLQEMRRWRQALPPTRVGPGTTGEVILEWRGQGFHLAAEISTPDEGEWLLNVPGQPIKQWQTDTRCTWIVRCER